jgi:phosphoribosylformimino-5-aminoimidazole carboxamide ribotide isomerase
MRVIPAIDLKDGKCVRLFQGDFNRCTEYDDDPPALAAKYQEMGFTELHIVDLDGAQSGQQLNRATIAAIAAQSQLTIQLGGGIRDAGTIAAWLDAGVSRCVIGSCAVTEPTLVREWLSEFGPERIMLALDVRFTGKSPRLATHGWTTDNELTLWQCLEDYQSFGLQQVLCTDVSRDGAMSGPNLDLYVDVIDRFPAITLQASGGVRNMADLDQLQEIGAHAAITGRALLDGRITETEIRSFLHAA